MAAATRKAATKKSEATSDTAAKEPEATSDTAAKEPEATSDTAAKEPEKIFLIAKGRLLDPFTQTLFPKEVQVRVPEITSWAQCQIDAGLMEKA